MITALNGVNSLGLSTIVQPAASAGATLHMIWLAGQFHGVISPHTPIGSRTMRLRPAALGEVEVAQRRDGVGQVDEPGGRLGLAAPA